MEFIPNAVTEKFKTQVLFALDVGLYKDYKQLADELKWNRTALSAVMNNKRNVPHKIATDFDALYIQAQKHHTGEGKVEAEKIGVALETLVNDHEDRIRGLETGFQAIKNIVAKKLEPLTEEKAESIRKDIEDLHKELLEYHLALIKKRQTDSGA